ncbi:hypothetical protein SARC_03307 [Sphaeroforma arctica JP610]|uniref:SMP-LTD domain-containing protein n=1 Tax=Sphaeroforma arctica JP610 TaxID=667725 RepID=A0A0L0G6A6_9EUKA|nr:hypothetical protein SARC_03307 [Sphaeroforma arctica JP610]KNC84474.1 hypothetical protein SARC_03307 [Sphaeroforma arctica JP610]|eukprot:XP_014158376.1 hypothetical protein SARC_03307 [Sphaeroforma arctica JP610]
MQPYSGARLSASQGKGDIDAPIDLPPELAAKLSDSDSPGTDRFPAGQKALPVPENSLFMNMLMLHGFLALRDTRKMRERFEAWMETKIMDLKKVIGSVSLVEYDLGHSTPFLTNCQVTESVVANDFNRTTVYCDLRYTGALSFTLHVGTVEMRFTEIRGAESFC